MSCDMSKICPHIKVCGEIECPYVTMQREDMENFCQEQGIMGNCNNDCENYGTVYCIIEEE